MKFLKGFIIFLCGILIGGICIKYNPLNFSYIDWVTVKYNKGLNSKYYQDKYGRFETVDAIFHENYYYPDKLDSGNMIKSALKAYVDASQDPYTVYMDADENSGFMDELEGQEQFVGIGAVVSKKDYYILIEEVLKNSPAYKVGIMPLDRVVIVDGEYVQDETLNEAVSRIKGPVGTEVNLVIERIIDGESKFSEYKVEREVINVPSVSSKTFDIGEKKIGYIEISIIGEETEKLLKQEISDLNKQGIEGVILDLRGNGGGYLDIGVKVASHFIPKGQLVVETRYRGSSNVDYYSKGYGDLEGYGTVVLVDGLTASAGEIIALALQQQIGAKIVGTTTFGKGSIQAIQPFSDGDSLKYTVGARYPPSETSINGVGITPDIIVEFDVDSYLNDDIDNQLEEAKNLFK